jgi:hypothetical protein
MRRKFWSPLLKEGASNPPSSSRERRSKVINKSPPAERVPVIAGLGRKVSIRDVVTSQRFGVRLRASIRDG